MPIFTEEILNQGKSRNGFWSNKQLYALGLTEIKKGWKKVVLGKEMTDEKILAFLNLKDKHLPVIKNTQQITERNATENEHGLILLTEEIILQGKSRNGGWSAAQLGLLGVQGFEKGWKNKVIGNKFPAETINRFILLKDEHLNKQKQSEPRVSYDTLSVVNSDLPIDEQYRNQNWIDLRKKVLLRDNYSCKICKQKGVELHVHHIEYPKGKFVWEIDPTYLITVCRDCHEKIHDKSINSDY